MRQDPDVIMVGEIRDRETADIAIRSSLTGHFVFSTLHTNDAPSAITRLTDMGVENYLITSSVVAVLAQRLVRVICEHCKAKSGTRIAPDGDTVVCYAGPRLRAVLRFRLHGPGGHFRADGTERRDPAADHEERGRGGHHQSGAAQRDAESAGRRLAESSEWRDHRRRGDACHAGILKGR